jgi:hypothetical protein
VPAEPWVEAPAVQLPQQPCDGSRHFPRHWVLQGSEDAGSSPLCGMQRQRRPMRDKRITVNTPNERATNTYAGLTRSKRRRACSAKPTDETNGHWLLHYLGTSKDTPNDQSTRSKFHENMIADSHWYKQTPGNTLYAAAMAEGATGRISGRNRMPPEILTTHP